jgi:hypothetical protein
MSKWEPSRGTGVTADPSWYVRARGETMVNSRSIGAICGVLAALGLAACGSGARQDASEPSGHFGVDVTAASFPSTQRLSEHTHLVLTVRNTGSKTIPNIAATICNVTCAYPAPAGEGTSVAAFAHALQMQGLANPSRPVWVIDQTPGQCYAGCNPNSVAGAGSPGGAVTANSNTWALGPLKPGATAKFDWGVTAVVPGRWTVAWEIAAGLNGKAKAVLGNGSAPQGTFPVTIANAPAQTYVNNNGQIVTTSSSAP